MAHNYPSDITREQFEVVRTELESARIRTKPRKYDLYDIFCAALYIVRNGIQWRALPGDFPKWQLVYYYYSIWKEPDENGESLLDKLLKKNSWLYPYLGSKEPGAIPWDSRLEKHPELLYGQG